MAQQEQQIVRCRVAELLRRRDLPAGVEPVAQRLRIARLGPRLALLAVANPRPRSRRTIDPQQDVEPHPALLAATLAGGSDSAQRIALTLQIRTGCSRFFTFAGASASSTKLFFPARSAHSSLTTIMSSRAMPHRRE